MSAFGTKRTSSWRLSMFAIGDKADVVHASQNVRL
jgi:hypothetical protein